jgi:uncharacterized cupin superfamily protein
MDEPFVMNLADAPASGHPRRETTLDFEEGRDRFPDTGVNVQIMQPGQPNCLYHSEPVQEDFLVLEGACIAIIEGEERPLRQWDFVHCPAGVAHVFVGAGTGPCAVLMIGSRREDAAHYPVDPVAAKYGASAARATDDPAEAYAEWRRDKPLAPVANPWPSPHPFHFSTWIENREPGRESGVRYGIVVDPTPNFAGTIEVLFDHDGPRRLDAAQARPIDCAILKAEDPDAYERMLRHAANYMGR